MKTGKIIAEQRDIKGWSRSLLAEKADISHVMVGKYERGEAVPSLEVAKKIADALEVTLDYLAGEGSAAKLNKKNLQRLIELELLGDDKKEILYDLIDTYIRDAKTRMTYAA
ncbi:MAG: helix-turn-helix transcriptional regulator [Bacteroidota bacterium]